MKQAALTYGVGPPPFRAHLRKAATVCLCVVGGGLLASVGVWKAFQPREGRGVSRAAAPISGLPPDTSNINYRLGGAFDPIPACYEFDTSEQSFRDWAASKNWTLEQAGGVMTRYDQSQVTINRGLFYHWTEEDSGVHAAFDRDTGRAYFYNHTR